jgi:Domain of unknown function (DUF5606)
MEYGKIIAVTGLPGLFELLTSKNDGAIVRSLEDKSSRFVSSRVHNFSHLESIEVFTVKDNVNLVDIFHAMEKDGAKGPDTKDAGQLKKYFEKVFPDLDFERVYSSDLKKMVRWFDILKDNNVEIKLTEHPEEPAEEEGGEGAEETVIEARVEKKEAKKTENKEAEKPEAKKSEPKKKAASVKEEKEATTAKKEKKKEEEEKPAKKAVKKSAPKKK